MVDGITSQRQKMVRGQRRLLSRVRDVMAGPDHALARLSKITEVIAADIVAEVCSVYVMRAGEILELFATHGLKPSAVNRTWLRVGEGIIGDIAASSRPLVVADAPAHPNFAYRPETGEDDYHSMMGVPVLRGGRVIGVLAVQNRIVRKYVQEEVETLQTVAMVLAEMIAAGDLVDGNEIRANDGLHLKPVRLEGISLSPGLGVGEAFFHQPEFKVENVVATDADHERRKLGLAFTEMHGALDELMDKPGLADEGEHLEILETYRLIAEDAGWLRRMDDAIQSGLTAEAAVEKVRNDLRARMLRVKDPYLRERIHDFDDLAHRLLNHLTNNKNRLTGADLPDGAIVVAHSMGPAQLLEYDGKKLQGIILEDGSPTSHMAIVARALDVPVVGYIQDALGRIEPGDRVIVDSEHGLVFVRPGDEAHQAFVDSAAALVLQKAKYAELRDKPSQTLDQVRVDVTINAGLMIDMKHLNATGASGVGLFRTELPFMVRSKFPRVDEQMDLYKSVLVAADGKTVVFRTLDIGGDKALPYWKSQREENPALGWRAIRVSIDRPALLRQQLRALIRAAAGRKLSIMFPMIAEVAEFESARELLNKELTRERRRGAVMPENISVGVMLEVPSLLFQLDALLERVDFISVGSNDLAQFIFASDRGNPKMSGRFDDLSPAMMNLLSSLVIKCDRANVPLSLCGEMASKPLDAMALIGLGFRRLSLSTAAVGPVKAMLRSLSVAELQDFIGSMLQSSAVHSLREDLRRYAMDHNVTIS